MRPKHPETSNLSWKQLELFAHKGNDGTCTTITREERGGILALQRIGRVRCNGMEEENAVHV